MFDQDDFKFPSPIKLKFRNSLWFAGLLLLTYIAAIVLANYLITHYGQIALPFVAFALIPFDLVIRDLMQDRWQDKRNFGYRMFLLIFLGGVISYATGTGSARVNFASYMAFTCAASLDALTYQWMIKYGRILRINGATLTAAITDSIIFVTIAFSSVNWKLVGLQIGMKVAGGFVWSLLLFKLFRTSNPNFPKWQPLEGHIAPQLWGLPVKFSEHSVTPNEPIILGDGIKITERFPKMIVHPPLKDCWLCFGGGYKGQICQCHHHPPGRLNSLPCNMRCNPK